MWLQRGLRTLQFLDSGTVDQDLDLRVTSVSWTQQQLLRIFLADYSLSTCPSTLLYNTIDREPKIGYEWTNACNAPKPLCHQRPGKIQQSMDKTLHCIQLLPICCLFSHFAFVALSQPQLIVSEHGHPPSARDLSNSGGFTCRYLVIHVIH